jgi:hypothetical protein
VRRLGVSNGFDFSVNVGADFKPIIEFGFVGFVACSANVFDDVTRKEVKVLVNNEVPNLNLSLLVMSWIVLTHGRKTLCRLGFS